MGKATICREKGGREGGEGRKEGDREGGREGGRDDVQRGIPAIFFSHAHLKSLIHLSSSMTLLFVGKPQRPHVLEEEEGKREGGRECVGGRERGESV